MNNWKLTNKAVEDLDSIWAYTKQKWSEIQADKYYKDLISEIQSIALQNNNFDKEYSEIKENLYARHCQKHLIFYQKQPDNTVLVIRILHESMDLKSKF